MTIKLIQQRLYTWSDSCNCDILTDDYKITNMIVFIDNKRKEFINPTHQQFNEIIKIHSSKINLNVELWDGRQWLKDIVSIEDIFKTNFGTQNLLQHLYE